MDYIFKTNGGTCEYDSFSSGERMRLNIAVSFAFRDFMATRSNIVSNILILDEYIDSNIDALAIEGIINILKEYIMIYNQNIFVISHRKEIDNSIFTNIIQVQKQNNVSKIKYLT
jgi:DNA repair exonuclease SbcCD ATPase subunit